MNKQHIHKAALTLFAVSLVFGQTAWAASSTTGTSAAANAAASSSSKQRFPDVAVSHWATKHITKLALLGIVEGNEKGQYEPEASVTQEQVITMAIRMMGLESEAKAMNISSYVLPFDVSDYAKPYVVMALEKGLLKVTEELEIAKSGSGKWGARQASREWVAKLSVRTVGKDEEAQALANEPSSFKDNASISAWALGYINEAVALKIVDGMEDGTFKPKSPVTRAQMATFLSRAGQYSNNGSKSVTGIVDTIENGSLIIVDDLGVKNTYEVTADTVYFGLNGTTAADSSTLKAENKVFLIVSEGRALYAEVLEEKAVVSNTLQGVLVRVDAAAGTMTLEVDGAEAVIGFVTTASIQDLNGKGISLSALTPGWTLELKRTGSRAKYSSIAVKHIPLNKTAEGVVQALDHTERTLTVVEKGAGVVEYPLAESVTYMNEGAAGDISTIRAKDKISFKITNDYVTHMDMIEAYQEPTDSGKLLEFRSDKNIAYITLQKPDNKFATYAIAQQTNIMIPGVDYAALKDLVIGDQVKLTLDEQNAAYQIQVTSRSMSTTYMNTIVSYDADSKLLTVKDAQGVPGVYQLSDTTRLDVGGAAMPHTSAGTYLTKGRKLDITASSDTNVKEVRVVYSYEGSLVRLDSAANELKLKLGEQILTVKVQANPYVEIFGQINSKLSDLQTGDRIKVVYNSLQDSVSGVQAVRTMAYRLTDKVITSRTLTLKSEAAGTISSVALPATVKVYNQASTEITVADLSLDEPLFVTYAGTQIDKVVSAKATRGKVTAVDAAAGKITLTDASGVTQTINAGASLKVKLDGSTNLTTLSAVKAGDRVEVVKDPTGVYTLTVAQALLKKVNYSDTTTKQLFVLREYLTEPTNYPYHSSVYVHKAGEITGGGMLYPNESVKIYLVDGKIIEVEKQ